MAALRELAATCAYATMEDEMLRDQLLEKAYAPAVRERLLMETSLTLDSAITLACQVEQALQLSSVLMGAAAVHAVAPQKPRYRRDNRRRSDPATNRPPQRAQQKQRTYTLHTWLMQPTAQLPKLNATVVVRLATSQKFAAQLNK